MAISEANAALEILSKVIGTASTIVDNYRTASEEIKAFPEKMKQFQEKAAEWDQMLKKYPLQADHPVVKSLTAAVEALTEAEQKFRALLEVNCCFRRFCKGWSPERWITITGNVEDAFSKIHGYVEEKQKTESILAQEANKNKAPFGFSADKNYVPIKLTADKIRKVLEDDSSGDNVVLLYGDSGWGKSTLTKFLALDYYGKSKGTCGEAKFSDGVVFIHCGRNADSLAVMRKLWVDLGYTHDTTTLAEWSDPCYMVEDLRKLLMKRLDGKSVLIILDDAWDQKLVEALRMTFKGVKYLISSQQKKIGLHGVEFVQIDLPNAEEARNILSNHIIGWNGQQFPKNVQKEVDGLIQDVGNHPLILANLALSVKHEVVPDLKTWTGMRKELKDTIQLAHEANDTCTPTVYNEPYQRPLIASLTMAIDLISEKARSLLFALTICSGYGVPGNVLRLWFTALHDASTRYYDSAYKELVERSLITVKRIKVPWTDEPWNSCSVHDLRRELMRDLKKEAIQDILQQLTRRARATAANSGDVSSDRNEELDLAATLVILYGDMTYIEEATQNIQIHKYFREKPWRLSAVMSFVRLLHPASNEEWEKRAHKLARIVILHFLQFREFKDEAISNLLGIPEAFEVTCITLQDTLWYGDWKIPTTTQSLMKKVVNLIRPSMPFENFRKVTRCLHALRRTRGTSFSLHDKRELLIVWRTLLQEIKNLRLTSVSSEISQASTAAVDDVQRSVMSLLRCKSWHGVGTVSELMETLLNLLDADLLSSYEINLALLEETAEVFVHLARSYQDQFKTILLQDVSKAFVGLLFVTPKPALVVLGTLASTSKGAECIAFYPGALNELLRLLSDGSVNLDYVHRVTRVVEGIFINRKILEESQWMTFIGGVVEKYTTLLHVDQLSQNYKTARKLAQGLGIISRNHAFRKVVTDAKAAQAIVIHMKKDLHFTRPRVEHTSWRMLFSVERMVWEQILLPKFWSFTWAV